jgi:pilus assembly protein CpaF
VSAAVDLITDRVRDRVRREGVDLAADSDIADRFVREELRSYSERALGGSAPLIADEQAASSSTSQKPTCAISSSGCCAPLAAGSI